MAAASKLHRWLPFSVLVIAMILGAAGMWSLTPDTGPDPVAPPPRAIEVAVLRPAPSTPPALPIAAKKKPTPTSAPPLVERARIKTVSGYPPPDPDRIYEGQALRGLAQAAMERTPGIQDCYRDWSQRHGELPGRFTLNLTVPVNDNRVRATLPYAYPGGAELEDCVNDMLGDAQFTQPDEDFMMIWPVPMPIQ
ncbi:MAG: hypothetical protein GWP91_15250 [Rhodobacterales bacterium]|nr:hypothetical protein [Rhodobacterales bacterium]